MYSVKLLSNRITLCAENSTNRIQPVFSTYGCQYEEKFQIHTKPTNTSNAVSVRNKLINRGEKVKLFKYFLQMDMSVTDECVVFWSIVEREIHTLVPCHLKNLLR